MQLEVKLIGTSFYFNVANRTTYFTRSIEYSERSWCINISDDLTNLSRLTLVRAIIDAPSNRKLKTE